MKPIEWMLKLMVAILLAGFAWGCSSHPCFEGIWTQNSEAERDFSVHYGIDPAEEQAVAGMRMIVLGASDERERETVILLLILRDHVHGQLAAGPGPDGTAEAWLVDTAMIRKPEGAYGLDAELKFCAAFAGRAPGERKEQRGVRRLIGVLTVGGNRVDREKHLDVHVDLRGLHTPVMIRGKWYLQYDFHPEYIPLAIVAPFMIMSGAGPLP
jgi:hypothetical protein